MSPLPSLPSLSSGGRGAQAGQLAREPQLSVGRFLSWLSSCWCLSHWGLEPCAELTFAVETSGLWGSLWGKGCNRARRPKGVVCRGSIQGKGAGSSPGQGLRPGWD